MSKNKKNEVHKICVVGDGGCGKTTFLRSFTSKRKYIATVGVVVHSIEFLTSSGPISMDCWDAAGEERFGGLRDKFYENGKAALIIFDLSNRKSYEHVSMWYRDIIRICKEIPICLVGTKADLSDRREVSVVTFHKRKDLDYCEISTKAEYNVTQPFLKLARKITGVKDLVFTEKKKSSLPKNLEIVDLQKLEEMKKALKEAINTPLPDDDEEW